MADRRKLVRELLRCALSGVTLSGDDRRSLAMFLEGRVLELKASERDVDNQSYLDRLQRGYSWLWKAYAIPDESRDSDEEARFLFAWIAFNALYGVRRDWLGKIQVRSVDSSRPTPGISDLEWFLRKIQRLDATEGRIVDFLRRNQGDVKSVVEDPFLVEAYWKWNGELTNDRKKKDLRAVTESTHRRDLGLCLRIVFAWRLRTLRNLLVHGASTNRYSKRRETEDGQLSLAASTRLIERGVACFLAVMEDGDQKRWPPTEAPRAGSPLHGLRYDWPEPVAEEWELLRRTFRS